MDTDDHHSSSRDQHRPPVLLQSDDHYSDPYPSLVHGLAHHSRQSSDLPPLSLGPSQEVPARLSGRQRNYRFGDMSIDYNDDPLDDGGEGKREGGGSLPDDNEPVHVHSQACQDSCPVQDIYTETSYWRFSKGARTNLYGLAVVKELESASPSLLPVDNEQGLDMNGLGSKTRASIFMDNGDIAYSDLPARYVFVAAGASIRCFLGLQESFEFTLSTGDAPAEVTGGNNSRPVSFVGTGTGSADSMSTITNMGSSTASMTVIVPAPAPSHEIISMDAFVRKDERGCQLVVVLSIANTEDPSQFELRFYGANTFGKSIRDLLLQLPKTSDIQTIPIPWAPTKIIHAPVEDDPFEMAVLVAGSDSCVHFFAQDILSMSSPGDRLFDERSVDTHFSVLNSFSHCEHCVLSLVVKDYLTYRIVAAGTQNGTLNVGIIPRDPITLKLDHLQAKTHTLVLFAPITTLAVFTSRVQPGGKNTGRRRSNANRGDTENIGPQVEGQGLDEQQHKDNDDDNDNCNNEHEEEAMAIHLLVTCAIEQAFVYSDIIKHGLSQRSDLAECSYHDSILATHIMDADWDGRHEIMVGTYGRQLMVFKELSPGQRPYSMETNIVPNTPSIPGRQHQQQQQNHHQHHSFQSTHPLPPRLRRQHSHQPMQGNNSLLNHHFSVSAPSPAPVPAPHPTSLSSDSTQPLQWGMTWNRRFASPVYGIASADLNNDGLEELVITTLNGVSLFLPDSLAAKRRLAQVIERIQEIEEMKKMVEGLRKSNQELFEAAATAQRLKEQAEEEEEKKRQMEAEAQEEVKKAEETKEDGKEGEQGKEAEKPEEAATEATADKVELVDSLSSQESNEATTTPEVETEQDQEEGPVSEGQGGTRLEASDHTTTTITAQEEVSKESSSPHSSPPS
ncbi:MAG: hypothetical protein J3Q66DRAFT_352113 [Benniella sp.]|nr:MAG: hypothetical protein J3Q66DRAFT_352113 [Benniella sp.]